MNILRVTVTVTSSTEEKVARVWTCVLELAALLERGRERERERDRTGGGKDRQGKGGEVKTHR